MLGLDFIKRDSPTSIWAIFRVLTLGILNKKLSFTEVFLNL